MMTFNFLNDIYPEVKPVLNGLFVNQIALVETHNVLKRDNVIISKNRRHIEHLKILKYYIGFAVKEIVLEAFLMVQ